MWKKIWGGGCTLKYKEHEGYNLWNLLEIKIVYRKFQIVYFVILRDHRKAASGVYKLGEYPKFYIHFNLRS